MLLNGQDNSPIQISDIFAAEANLRRVFPPSPLFSIELLNQQLGTQVYSDFLGIHRKRFEQYKRLEYSHFLICKKSDTKPLSSLWENRKLQNCVKF